MHLLPVSIHLSWTVYCNSLYITASCPAKGPELGKAAAQQAPRAGQDAQQSSRDHLQVSTTGRSQRTGSESGQSDGLGSKGHKRSKTL